MLIYLLWWKCGLQLRLFVFNMPFWLQPNYNLEIGMNAVNRVCLATLEWLIMVWPPKAPVTARVLFMQAKKACGTIKIKEVIKVELKWWAVSHYVMKLQEKYIKIYCSKLPALPIYILKTNLFGVTTAYWTQYQWWTICLLRYICLIEEYLSHKTGIIKLFTA